MMKEIRGELRLFSSESVTEGHPDKICDQISDAILDAYRDIAMGVDRGGAGDQGIMFGYACNENEAYLPMPIYLAHQLAERLSEVRKIWLLPFLRPDGKTQVTLEYQNGKFHRVHTVLISSQHSPALSQELLAWAIKKELIEPVLWAWLDSETRIFVNPTGNFVIGGPVGDTGLTGRKIIVDTYGGRGRHGGGAFSGKDPTKVDRSAAYMARYLAKNIVASGLCEQCEIQLCYGIGLEQPLGIFLEDFGTGKVEKKLILDQILDCFDLSPRGIIDFLGLRTVKYQATASYGHFGRSQFPWEQLGSIQIFEKLLK